MHWILGKRPKLLTLIFYKIIKYRIRQYSSTISVTDLCIISGVRTPIGSFQGSLTNVTARELASKALSVAIERAGVNMNEIQELILGNVLSTGCGQSLSFQVAMSAGMPDTIIHSTVNKLCGSGMKAVMNGCQLISTNTQELVAAGGVESLSNAAYICNRKLKPLGNQQLKDTLLKDALIDPYDHVDVTSFAEESVKEYKYTRDDLDAYALESYSRAKKAQKSNVFAQEIIPITVKKKNKSTEVVSEDEEVKKLNIQKFRNLKPEMGEGGTITPGNTSGLADGAAMLILASGNYVLKRNLKPLARILSYADASVNRKKFCVAPTTAIQKALKRANLTTKEIQYWEISETFALTALLNSKLLKLDIKNVNRHGGTVSLGHPFGMTGARIIIHLAHTLDQGMLGCASISHATGGSCAVVIEKL